MKYVIVGGNTGGAGAAARLRRLDEQAEILLLEKGAAVSYSNCSLPYRLSETVDQTEKLVLNTPESLHGIYNIETRTNTQVISINRAAKKIMAKYLVTGQEYEESYDTLILAPGANAVIPRIQGIENASLFTIKTVADVSQFYGFLKESGAKKVSVIGGGFIGVEVAVNLREAGYLVALVEAMDQILKPYDYDMVQILQKAMIDHGVQLVVGDSVVAFQQSNLQLNSGRVIEGDAVVMAVGVRPDTALAADAGLEMNARGAIKVDPNYCTSDPSIYAVGDAVEVFNPLTHKPAMVQLAGPAQKQARQAADHIYGLPVRNTGFIGSSCIQVFEWNAASTGLTAAQCQQEGIPYDTVYVLPKDRVGIMPGSTNLHYKLIYEVPTGKVLGAQAISKGDAPKRIDVAATLIKFGSTVDDLRDLELCYAPPFSAPKDAGNYAGLVAGNLLAHRFRQVHVDQVRSLVESGAYILDVRPPEMYNLGHLKTSVNIPLGQLRCRLDEIPTDRPVYVHCQIGQSSYNAVMALQGHGFTNIYNISGGFLGICNYEYFNDMTQKRDPIVTNYCFG
ncbi:FAD-dependent oxidoreductase [Faecalibacterium sp. An122]|uniref:FAD-dependent oxidoreductase n=1 Tax=Faecalibacterium sp. An122 TaxID=1965551 RepID=UPI000B36EF7A|nr:FAD-dependent oxidoreductase [Faecalibacterium sp. An122]OUQ34228.1 pyridine nucleotide-disulfide oxidoreductase [Faecalibacterium sp. An122]